MKPGAHNYNVTIRSFKEILDKRKINLANQPEADSDNRSANYRLAKPNDSQLKAIYDSMLKQTKEDHLNCAGCGRRRA